MPGVSVSHERDRGKFNILGRASCAYIFVSSQYASSFNMNPNKWMLVNFDCSLLWVKDRFKLTQALVVDPLYLQHSYSESAIDYRVIDMSFILCLIM